MPSIHAYVIQDPSETLFLSTLRIKRAKCIDDFIKETTTGKEWKNYRQNGWKIIKVIIKTIET